MKTGRSKSLSKRIEEISMKQILEVGDPKQFLRADDVSWLIRTVLNQKREIERLKKSSGKVNES